MSHRQAIRHYQNPRLPPDCTPPFQLSRELYEGQVTEEDLVFSSIAQFNAALRAKFEAVSEALGSSYRFPDAAYGPLFLSHIAYLDACWEKGLAGDFDYLFRRRDYASFAIHFGVLYSIAELLPAQKRIVYHVPQHSR